MFDRIRRKHGLIQECPRAMYIGEEIRLLIGIRHLYAAESAPFPDILKNLRLFLR